MWRDVAIGLLLLASTATACSEETEAPPGGTGGAGGASSISTGTGAASGNTLEGAQLGHPRLLSAQRLAFGPGGVLLIGDGRSGRIVAVETGDTAESGRSENAFTQIDNLTVAAANAIGNGASPSEIQIDDIAVNPLSWRTYVAVTRYSTSEAFVLWVDTQAHLRKFDLSNVVYAVVDVTPDGGGAGIVTGLVWTDEHVIGSVTPDTFLRHELMYVKTPFEHEGRVRHATTRVFHRAWGQWTTDLPMDRFFTYEHQGETFVIGSFTSTVARFRSADLEGGGVDVLGATVFDLVQGRSVLDFMTDRHDEPSEVIALVSNVTADGQPGALRIPAEAFQQSANVNDESPYLLDFSGALLVPGVERVPELEPATKLAGPDAEHVVVLRDNALVTVVLDR